uniref:Uncharacterized protein n=1 Tax=Monodon monoceros TaxID=40151 RepID=A0A8C6ANA2_MONMO
MEIPHLKYTCQTTVKSRNALKYLQQFILWLALLVFYVLLTLRVDSLAPSLSWLSTYFPTIISVHLFQDGEKQLAMLSLFWVLRVLSLKFIFKMLLCQKLVEQTRELSFDLIKSLVFILLKLLLICTCWVNQPCRG